MDIVQTFQDPGAFAGKQNAVRLQKKAQRTVRMPFRFQHKESPFSQRDLLPLSDDPAVSYTHLDVYKRQPPGLLPLRSFLYGLKKYSLHPR